MSFADECCATLARLTAYVGAIALIAIVSLNLWAQLQLDSAAFEPVDQPGFTLAGRSRPAFAVSSVDFIEKSVSYEIRRHPAGGRKDLFRWGPPEARPMAELEIYRPGGELDPSALPADDLATRMAPEHPRRRALETAGVIDSKFGSMTLLRFPGRPDAAESCLGFVKRFEDPALRISGWSCQGTTLSARRAAIGCILDRLTLLASGNEPKLAELFARAELRRSGCGAAASVTTDWVTGADNPRLRGAL